MKTLLFTLVLITTFISKAQIIDIPNKIEIVEQKMILNNFERNGFKTMIDGDDKVITKSLIQYAEKTYGWKLKVKNEMIVGLNILTPTFSDKHFNINAYIAKTESGKELRFFGSFGTDVYINTAEYSNETTNIKLFLRGFLKDYYANYINAEITTKNKELAAANKSVTALNQKITATDKQVNKATIKIKKLDKKKAKAEEKIRKIEESITDANTEASVVKKDIETYSSSKEKLQKEESIVKEKSKLVTSELEILQTKLINVNAY